MRLLAIGDLHLEHGENRSLVQQLPRCPEDWLLVVGDMGALRKVVAWGLDHLVARFGQVVWVPGNHELWSEGHLEGRARYGELINMCRARGVLTPEDPWPVWPGDESVVIAPMFMGFDYSFAPPGEGRVEAVVRAAEAGLMPVDELRLGTDPWPDMAHWCAQRCDDTEARLQALPDGVEVVMVSHWPLRRDLVHLPEPLSTFLPWCGTTRTQDWPWTWPTRAVVSGHLHMRAEEERDGVVFHEVSLGYPRHWRKDLPPTSYLRTILTGFGCHG